jgi:hypothetical protein
MLTMDPISTFLVNNVLGVAAELVIPLMGATFVVGVLTRMLIWYVARSEHRFAVEFEKRVRRYVTESYADESLRVSSFHRICRQILEHTFHECFELRNKYRRRNFDHIMSLTDRVFLVEEGVARLVSDTLKQTRYLKRENQEVKMVELTKSVFDTNPFFNRLLGAFPVSLLNELINILPGLFIIGGIFGTFLGIAKGLPELRDMDLQKIEETKRIMGMFLEGISMAMIKSILGIFLSVSMSLINTVLAPEGIFYNLINRYSAALDTLWNETTTNDYDKSEIEMDAIYDEEGARSKNAEEGVGDDESPEDQRQSSRRGGKRVA